MSPGAFIWDVSANRSSDHRSIAWATAIAILFVAVAAASFALDQTLTLSSLTEAPPAAMR